MEYNVIEWRFMERIPDEPRIGPSHISLFMAIMHYYRLQHFVSPIIVYARDLKKQACISAGGTYHKCMKDLKELGFIGYVPSFDPVLGSLVYVGKINSSDNTDCRQ